MTNRERMILLMQYKILIVDDEPMLTELLADYLGDVGYLPYTATDSVNAMEKLNKIKSMVCLLVAMTILPSHSACQKSLPAYLSTSEGRLVPMIPPA